jgi:hypothetical protein
MRERAWSACLNSRTSEQIVSFSLQLLVPLVHKGTRQDIVLDVFLLGGLAYVLVTVNREQDIQLTRHSLIGVAVTQGLVFFSVSCG